MDQKHSRYIRKRYLDYDDEQPLKKIDTIVCLVISVCIKKNVTFIFYLYYRRIFIKYF